MTRLFSFFTHIGKSWANGHHVLELMYGLYASLRLESSPVANINKCLVHVVRLAGAGEKRAYKEASQTRIHRTELAASENMHAQVLRFLLLLLSQLSQLSR